jgi:hypothetical protein
MRIPSLVAIAAIAAGIIALVHGVVMGLNRPPAAAATSSGKTPQQRLDEAFDELGFQRFPLPPNWPRSPRKEQHDEP